jgi:hypothetical protein
MLQLRGNGAYIFQLSSVASVPSEFNILLCGLRAL